MFSIITPTYNRGYCLHRVYNSLINQTFQNFHWIIVDDCSTDSTMNLVKEWIKEDKIKIEYHLLEKNQGKSTAVNFGLNLCSQPYTIVADSDDSFAQNTLEDLSFLWQMIDLSLKPENIASIWTLTRDENNLIVGDLFPKNFWQVKFKERMLKNNVKGEKWACWRTSILSKYKMYAEPELNIQESQTWNRINKDYDFLCVNLAHRKYYNSSDGIIATSVKNSRIKRSKLKYYNSYYGLKDVKNIDQLKYYYYRTLSYNYASSLPFYHDKNKSLSFNKTIITCILFILMLPKNIIKRIL